MPTENREIKSTVFADLFGADELVGKRNFLSLYNALHGTHLEPECTRIERREIPQAVYRSISSDVSMLVGGSLIVLAEHQSTPNENMPLRFLEYYVHLLNGIVPRDARYRKRLYRIPAPEFYVFYNGTAPAERERVMRLSDAFMGERRRPVCEAEVRFMNIGGSCGGGKLPIVESCGILGEYCRFMEIVARHRAAHGSGTECSYLGAIREAVSEGVLVEYLERKSTEVINMFMSEYSYADDLRVQREEAREEGREQKALEDAQSFLANGVPAEVVARSLGMDVAAVEALAAKDMA